MSLVLIIAHCQIIELRIIWCIYKIQGIKLWSSYDVYLFMSSIFIDDFCSSLGIFALFNLRYVHYKRNN